MLLRMTIAGLLIVLAIAAPRSAPQTPPVPLPVPAASPSASPARSGAPLANATMGAARPPSRSASPGRATPRPSAKSPERGGTRATTVAGPRPTPEAPASARTVLAGTASWYCLRGRSACTAGYPAGGAYAAAGPALRAALGPSWRGRQVSVSSDRASVTVTLVDWCSCPNGRVLDLYAAAFGGLAPLSQGLVDVEVAL